MEDASNLTDRISELPHDILGGSILSMLPLKEAAATGILSKRWRYEWCFTTNLYFDSDDTLRDFRALKREFKNQKSCRYVNWVDHVLKQHRGSNIEQFRVCFDLDSRFASSIDKWIQFAMKKRVRVFVLDFLILYGVLYEDSYAFPCTLLGLDEKEKGSSLTPFRCGYGGFELLGVLHLFIEIYDANLVSFVYVGLKINVLLSNMPLLVEYSCAFSVPTLPNLKHLELIVPADDQWALNNLNSFLKASPTLQRLVLKLEFSPPPPPPPCKPLEEKLQLLSCELREELRILLFEPPKMLKAPECPHRNLKILEIVGYRGRINVVEHVIFNRKIKDVKEEEEGS
ncbi:PREDICTED: F-box/LRR-repeat [Prunus dulcis]|nr:PREDICTED: F-box/LRR-repeat [Prunus dulcis]